MSDSPSLLQIANIFEALTGGTARSLPDDVVPYVNFADVPVSKECLDRTDWLLMVYGSQNWPTPFPREEYEEYLEWYEDWKNKGFPNE